MSSICSYFGWKSLQNNTCVFPTTVWFFYQVCAAGDTLDWFLPPSKAKFHQVRSIVVFEHAQVLLEQYTAQQTSVVWCRFNGTQRGKKIIFLSPIDFFDKIRFITASCAAPSWTDTVGLGTKAQCFCPPYLKIWFFCVVFNAELNGTIALCSTPENFSLSYW